MKHAMRLAVVVPLLLTGGATTDPPKAKQHKPILTLWGHSELVIRVQFSPDGKRLATAAGDKTAAIWDAATGKRLLTLKGHTDFVSGLAFSPDGKLLATASHDQTVKVWDTTTGREIRTLPTHTVWVFAVAFSKDGTQLVTGDMAALDKARSKFAGEVKFWEAKTGKLKKTVHGHANGVVSLVYSPDGKRVASASVDGSVILWEVATGQAALTLRGQDAEVFEVTFSANGKRLATAHGDEGTVKVWETASGKRIMTLNGHKGRVFAVRFSPDGRLLASAGNHNEPGKDDRVGEIRVWDTKMGEVKVVLPGGDGGTYGLAFSPGGTRLATTHADGTVRIWSVKQLLQQAHH